jgi:hypothetical protein
VTVPCDKNDAVDWPLENWLPVRIEVVSDFGTLVAKALGILELAALEGYISRIIGDSNLIQAK